MPIDVLNLTEEQKIHLGIYHQMDHAFVKQKLLGLCGKIREHQDDLIRSHIFGERVLDIGSGYGTLSHYLANHGFRVTSLEPHAETRRLGMEWFGIQALPHDVYSIDLTRGSIDTVILRECIEHLDFELALQSLRRLAPPRILIFQSHLNWMLDLARRAMKHYEFNTQPVSCYREQLAAHGYSQQSLFYRDVIAFPLSGGFHVRQLFPRNDSLEHLLVKADRILTCSINAVGLGRFVCWRYLLTASKEGTRPAPS